MKKIQSGWTVFKRIMLFIFKKPFLLIPMLMAWAVYVFVAVWIQDNYDLTALDTVMQLVVIFGFTCLSTFTISISSLFILEMIEQHETTGRMNPVKALFAMLTKDLWRALPIIIVWSVIDFVLLILISFLNSLRERENGPDRPKGPFQIAVEAFKDLLRMGSMTVFTVIAWENLGPKDSFDKGYNVFKKQFAEMLTGFALNKIVGLLTLIPIVIALIVMSSGNIWFDQFFTVLIVYISIIWSLGKLIEQLYVSELYLWYRHYEKAIEEAKRTGIEPPVSINDVPMPSFTDSNFDLKKEC